MTIFILNTTVVPCAGLWDVQPVELRYAQYLAKNFPLVSAIGHESTATIISSLLGADYPVNRITVAPEEGDQLLCFKLQQRAPEGVILTVEEIEELGYQFFLMELIAGSKAQYASYLRRLNIEHSLWESRNPRRDSRDSLGGHRD